MKNEVLINEIDELKKALKTAILSFTSNEFNNIPFEGSWTAAQVTEHLTKAVDPAILYGNVVETERDRAEKVKAVENLFLDFSTKMQSPAFVMPSREPHSREEMTRTLNEVWQRIKEGAQNLELSLTCTDFEIPGFGAFTRFEWIWFYICHTRRHIHQLSNIKRELQPAP